MKRLPTLLLGLLLGPLLLVGLSVVFAGDANIPNTFTSNTPAIAAEVNANFEALRDAINDNHARIQAIENQPGCYLDSASQPIPDGVDTDLILQEDSPLVFPGDPLDMHSPLVDPHVVTIPRDGFYLVVAHVVWGGNTDDKRALKLVTEPPIGTGAVVTLHVGRVDALAGLYQHCVRTIPLSAGERISLRARQDSGVSLNARVRIFGVTYLRSR